MNIIINFLIQDEAVTAIEYALIATLISIAIIAGLTLVSTNLSNKYDTIKNAIP